MGQDTGGSEREPFPEGGPSLGFIPTFTGTITLPRGVRDGGQGHCLTEDMTLSSGSRGEERWEGEGRSRTFGMPGPGQGSNPS